MAKSLVVVESPAKAKTINKYLGNDYKVIASRKKVLKELKDEARRSTDIFIATDPGREGEAIGWHLAEELGSGNRRKPAAVGQGAPRSLRRPAILADLKAARWVVDSVTTKERRKSAVPPFITSKLQQASRFPVKKAMMIAQQPYEGIELPGEGAVGLITYMRTDSTRLSDQALADVREFIGGSFGAKYVPEKPNVYKTKSDAQDAHEAIRPTSLQYHPDAVRDQLTSDQYYLYKLIWNRFVASQMPPATFDDTTVDVIAGDPSASSGAVARRER